MKKIVIEDTIQGRIIRLTIDPEDSTGEILEKLKKRYKVLRELELALVCEDQVLEIDEVALDKVKIDGGGKAARFELCAVEFEDEDSEEESESEEEESEESESEEEESEEEESEEEEIRSEPILRPGLGVVDDSSDDLEIISPPVEQAPEVQQLAPLAEAMGDDRSAESVAQRIEQVVQEQAERIVSFMTEICAIPSMESEIREVGERIAAEMEALGFDEVRFDQMGNVLGRIGDGPRSILFDSHIDTVGIGDPDAWEWDPFEGKLEDGILYARGACDEKGSTPGMIYAAAIARDLGLLDGWTVWYFGNMEEWCDGIAPHALVEVEKIRPELVVIGEPTKMQVYRGHKGRVEMQVVSKGRSAHAASNELGDNAIYKLLPVIEGVALMGDELPSHEFLGQGRITATDMTVKTPSINAVPDEATLYIDRRVTFGETVAGVIEEVVQWIPESDRDMVQVEMLHYAEASYTGFVFPVDKYFPAWALDEKHPLVQAGQRARALLWQAEEPPGKWNFSTNGIYWMGKADIPSIGFGPGDEIHAHTTDDQVKLEDVVRATSFYALLPFLLTES